MSVSPDSKEGQSVEGKNEPVSVSREAIDQLDGLLPVDEFEEEVDVNGQIERHKGIYILPNLFTTAALFAGFYSILRELNTLIFIIYWHSLDGKAFKISKEFTSNEDQIQ